MSSIAFAGILGNLASVPWAIHPAALNELLGFYARHSRGEAANVAAIEAMLGRPLSNEHRGVEILAGGVAVVSVQGAIVPKANLLTQVSGATSAQLAARDVASAAANPSARSILLDVDSPGGAVLGVPELAQAMRDASAKKPVVALSDGTLASAAYWVAAAANSVYITGPGVQVGSIGVAMTHRETSAAQAAAGIKTTEIMAGKYKRIASANEPLSKEGRASLQAQVDYYYSLFVHSVASDRGVSTDTVLSKMADGRVFIGQQAITAGLVDGITSFDALVADLAANPALYAKRRTPPATGVPARATTAIAGPSPATHSPTPLSKGVPVYSTTTTASAPPSAAAVAAAAAAQRSAACAAAAKSITSLFSEANGIKPNADALERVRSSLPPPAKASVEAASAEAPRPAVSADKRAAQNAAAARVVALFKQANPLE